MVRFVLAASGMLALSLPSASEAAVLFNNGPVVDGAGLSILATPATTLGWGAQTASNNRVADNFTVGGGGWNVSSLDFFSYQTGAMGFTFTGATWSIVSGNDVNTGSIVASGTSAVTNGGLLGYRVTSTTLADTNRAIYRLSADIPDFVLTPGNYFITWSMAGTAASGPWAPPVIGSLGSGNALQSIAGAPFATVIEAGAGQTVELPFAINGTLVSGAVPEPATWAMMILGFGAIGGVLRRRSGAAKAAQTCLTYS